MICKAFAARYYDLLSSGQPFLVEKCLLLKVTELSLSNKLRNKWLLTLPDDDSSVQELQ